jgi:hypothetical protein
VDPAERGQKDETAILIKEDRSWDRDHAGGDSPGDQCNGVNRIDRDGGKRTLVDNSKIKIIGEMICMIQIIILQAQRKIQEAKRRVELYTEINQGGHLDMMIRVERSNIKQLENMIQELENGIKEAAAAI